MMLYHIDRVNKYVSIFDEKTGKYLRSGTIIKGRESDEDPFMAQFPELIDVGIMGHCFHGKSGKCLLAKIECYQNGANQATPNMTLEDFESIVKQCRGRTFQFALGGRGDPDQHAHFEEIIKLCHDNKIVPNFTTSGYGMNQKIALLCKKYCGSVAISWYRNDYTLEAIKMLLEANVKTNIHYVLSNNTIDEAIAHLKNNDFPKGINAMLFLLHKPIGLGSLDNVLTIDDERVKEFFSLVDRLKFDFKIGFDSCSTPGILNLTKSVSLESIDTCEGARWSAYISADMKMMPCSFDNQSQNWAVDLNHNTIEDAWNSMAFDDFRNHLRYACKGCKKRAYCMGGCPIVSDIVLCNSENKDKQIN